MIIKPGPQMFRHPASLIALPAGLFSALALVATNKLADTELPVRILIYNFGFSTLQNRLGTSVTGLLMLKLGLTPVGGVSLVCYNSMTMSSRLFTLVHMREDFTEMINRVAYARERVILTHHGKGLLAMIPIEDLELLESLSPSVKAAEQADFTGQERKPQLNGKNLLRFTQAGLRRAARRK